MFDCDNWGGGNQPIRALESQIQNVEVWASSLVVQIEDDIQDFKLGDRFAELHYVHLMELSATLQDKALLVAYSF